MIYVLFISNIEHLCNTESFVAIFSHWALETSLISVGQVEVKQGPNSVFYGENDKSDGIGSSVAKVENLSTARGFLLAPPLHFLAMS